MSYLTQMLALAVQNFLSAATGIVVVFALIRGFVARSSASIGNFWVDITRVTAYVLLPLSLVFAVFLVSQGVIQNFSPYKEVATLDVTTYQTAKNGPDGQPLKDDKGAPVMEDVKSQQRRPSRWARSLRRKPSRCWAPTAAASSTPTRPTRTRTRRR